jgi:hypothetical protein
MVKKHYSIGFLCVLIFSSIALAQVGKRAQENSAGHIQSAENGLLMKLRFLHRYFGNVPHFTEALQQAVIKDGYSLLEFLVIDEKAVNNENAEEYAEIELPDLPDVIHTHLSPDGAHAAITVGGYPVTNLSMNKAGALIMTLDNVALETVKALEAQVDKSDFVKGGDGNGLVTYEPSAVGYQVTLTSIAKLY